MAWARFTARHEHRWPSRAISVHRPDGGIDGKGLYQVRREVLEAAKEAGRATEAKNPATPRGDGAKRKAAESLARGDTPPGRDAAPRDGLEHDDLARRGADLPAPDRAG